MTFPVIDLHCDLLIHLTRPKKTIHDLDLGCALPYLKKGNVKLQVMAIYTPTHPNSVQLGIKQSELFSQLSENNTSFYNVEKQQLSKLTSSAQIGIIAAIENASSFCSENDSLNQGFKNLKYIQQQVGNLLYISLTHHAENRFGGGNYTTIGLKNDGKALLDYLDNKNIAVDFSHTSDSLANDILTYISQNNLNIPIMASHSNYRSVYQHQRNLPDEIAKEIIFQNGLIGVNFLRAFVHPENSKHLYTHIDYGLELGGADAICYGADYFYHKNHPDKTRIPFFHKEHHNASCYQNINKIIAKTYNKNTCAKISYLNTLNFLQRLWK